ncbi:H/ACA ribonucleoprotein complex non-core subunit NAF1 [Bufo gargarizans]|uniref:H/ACA ribonucleoprotein complex non-core subunit NAF1 n=1 Tax=Bufo gargarizans TaxID=30331 RepID=UPI001CF2CD84|nr:H/ACA ribonucleoprotein complex non-core subunit NAF1 [Bufo gargarizans]
MEAQEEIPGETAHVLENNNNLEEDVQASQITELDTPDKTPVLLCNNGIVHSISGKAQDESREEGPSNDNVGVQSLPLATEEDTPTVLIQSLPCTLPQQEAKEVAEQLEGLHFQNHTMGDYIGETDSLQVNNCLPISGKIEAEDVYANEESSSEDSSSDSDSDSSSSSSTSSSSLSSLIQLDDEPLENNDVPLKTKDELLVDELPAVEELSISLPDHVELKPFGTVSSIIEQLVIIESLRDILPLNEETVVFKEDRGVVGKIFEIFGPVPHPFYVVRFNSKDHIESIGVQMKDALYFAPSVKDFTQYIIPDALKRDRGSDASWTNDQEPPPDVVDYSDDEKERDAKQKKKAQNLGKKKQKSDPDKPATNAQVSHRFSGAQTFSRRYERNGSTPHFSRGRGSHTQENNYGQHHQPYYPSGFLGQHMMPQSYTYHNPNSQEYTMPMANNGYHAPMPNFYGQYANMQAFPPPPPDVNWPAYAYMQNSPLYNLPPPPPPPPPPAPPNSGEPSY